MNEKVNCISMENIYQIQFKWNSNSLYHFVKFQTTILMGSVNANTFVICWMLPSILNHLQYLQGNIMSRTAWGKRVPISSSLKVACMHLSLFPSAIVSYWICSNPGSPSPADSENTGNRVLVALQMICKMTTTFWATNFRICLVIREVRDQCPGTTELKQHNRVLSILIPK